MNLKVKGLGNRFLNAVDSKIQVISNNPKLFQTRFKAIRFALIKHFPYAIHYLVEEQRVIVIAVLSTDRNPKDWKSK